MLKFLNRLWQKKKIKDYISQKPININDEEQRIVLFVNENLPTSQIIKNTIECVSLWFFKNNFRPSTNQWFNKFFDRDSNIIIYIVDNNTINNIISIEKEKIITKVNNINACVCLGMMKNKYIKNINYKQL